MIGSRGRAAVAIVVLTMMLAGGVTAADPALKLRIAAIGDAKTEVPFIIELVRWSTDAERAPLLAALLAPPPPPAAPAAPAAGRGGRGGRGVAPPLGPLARLTGAVKKAETLGYVWGDGVTGYSIKYAWHATATDGRERIVLIVDRRLAVPMPDRGAALGPATEADFTLIEMRIDGKGRGEGKTSLAANVVVDAAAQTLALDGYTAASALLKVTR